MIALRIPEVKQFMAKILIQNVFDNFLLKELEMNTFNKFRVDGRINKSYFNTDELEALGGREYSKWSEVRPFVLSLVKGNKTPLSFHIVLQLSHENTEAILRRANLMQYLDDITGLYFNIRYENGELTGITGTGFKTFSLDKTIDHEWDENMKKFLKYHEIPVEV
ncbi:MAG: hypothetical protein E7256_04705 [Lachnospiraceae bacterium]|nr:hypothetical protein [Lachnospiraceae bacterium]